MMNLRGLSIPAFTLIALAGCAAPEAANSEEPAESGELAWTTCGPDNLATAAYASAESSLPGTSPQDLVDGSSWTAWRAGPLYAYQSTWIDLSWDEGVPARCLRIVWDRADYAREVDVWVRDLYEWKFWGTHYANGTDTNVVLGTWADEIQIELRNANGRYVGVREVEVR